MGLWEPYSHHIHSDEIGGSQTASYKNVEVGGLASIAKN